MESNQHEELTAAQALASTAAGRGSVARRVAIPWTWDAGIAVSVGVFMALISYVTNPWTTIVIALWVVSFVAMNGARQRRSGVVADGSTRRTFDPLQLWAWLAALSVFAAGLVLGSHWWEGAPVVAAAVGSGVVFAGSRLVNRRALARIRDAA